MRSTTFRSFVFLALAGAIAACTATAVNPTDSDSGTMMAAEDSGAQIDSSIQDMDSMTTGMDTAMVVDAGRDSAITDTGIVDAPFDGVVVTDASFDPPGSPCPTNNLIQRDPNCGICGYRDRVCLALTDGGATKWQPWGACQAEVAGGCVPAATDSVACGNCGMQARTCSAFCAWEVGGCTGTGVCAAGTVEFAASVSCDAGLGRTRTCDTSCVWGSYSTTCGAQPPPPTTITISSTVGNVATARFNMPSTQPKIVAGFTSSNCPITLSTSATSYVWVKVKNPTALTAKVSVWTSLQMGGVGTLTDTMMTAYAGTTLPPSTVAGRDACMGIASDDCDDTTTDSTACTSNGAGLMKASVQDGDKSLTIPANGFVWVYVTAYLLNTVTDIQVSTKTHSLL
jgi:hypothetical protein